MANELGVSNNLEYAASARACRLYATRPLLTKAPPWQAQQARTPAYPGVSTQRIVENFGRLLCAELSQSHAQLQPGIGQDCHR